MTPNVSQTCAKVRPNVAKVCQKCAKVVQNVTILCQFETTEDTEDTDFFGKAGPSTLLRVNRATRRPLSYRIVKYHTI